MERCPLCRALLNGADTCRRCRAELQSVQRVAGEARALVNAAMHHLSRDDADTATRLLQRALVCHAAPDIRALLRLVPALPADMAFGEAPPSQVLSADDADDADEKASNYQSG